MNIHPVHEMTKEEAIVRLCDAARTSADPDFLRAAVIAAKCLARAGIHKRRNHSARVARGKDARLATPEPSAPAPVAAETKPTTQPTTMNEKPLGDILTAMRGNEFDDPHLDADGIIGARNICRDFADKIEKALHDPQQVLTILWQFHDEHYSVFPRDQLTERLCHAFYGEFVKNPEEA